MKLLEVRFYHKFSGNGHLDGRKGSGEYLIMMEWLEHIVFWHWWILAGLLLILELTAPAFFFLWLGIAAAAVGLIMLVFPSIGVETQLVLFAIASIVSVIAWRKYRESPGGAGSERPGQDPGGRLDLEGQRP